MATDLKRFSISVSSEMEKDLDNAKRSIYYNQTQTDMIRELIESVLAALLQAENKKEIA